MNQERTDELIRNDPRAKTAAPDQLPPPVAEPSPAPDSSPLAWFGNMVEHCLEYARAGHAAGQPVVGIMCEYAPRELILAAGGIPVCLCGGSADTIPAAEAHLPANLCPLVKSTYGYHLVKANPFLEMASLVVAETTCDGKKKMFELMGESRATYLLELPHRDNDADAIDHWWRELRRFKHDLEFRFAAQITDDRVRAAVRVMNLERTLRRSLAELMKADEPPLTGRQLLDCKTLISGLPAAFAQYEAILEMCGGRSMPDFAGEGSGLPAQDAAAAPDRNQAVQATRKANAGRVRVLLTGVPLVHGAERVLDIIEGHGGLVVCMENCTGLKPILQDVNAEAEDPLRALAEKYFTLPCSVRTRNEARIDSLRTLAAEYRVDCVIDLIWQACLTYSIESFRVKRLVEHELGLPYLRLETDYAPSDSARIATRVEALFETAR